MAQQEALTGEKNKLNEVKETLVQQVSELDKKVKELEDENSRAKEDLDKEIKAKIDQLTKQHEDDEKEKGELSQRLESLQEENSKLSKNCIDQIQKINEAQKQNESLNSKIEELLNAEPPKAQTPVPVEVPVAVVDENAEEKILQRIKEAQENTERIYQTKLKDLQDEMS